MAEIGDAFIRWFVLFPLELLTLIIFVNVILSWLIGFNVVNPHNPVVRTLWNATEAITGPLLNPIRRVLPPLGGMDLSPLILLLIVFFLRDVIAQLAY